MDSIYDQKFELISIDNLNCKIPEIQRTTNNDNIQKMIEYQEQKYSQHKKYILFDAICVAINKNSQSQYLIDGQHRVLVYKKLREKYPDRTLEIFVSKLYYENEEDLNNIYKTINIRTNNPITNLEISDYEYLNNINKNFLIKFPQYIKTTKNPHRPHINIESINNYMLEKDFVKILKEKNISSTEFCNKLEELNNYYDILCRKNPDIFKEYNIKDSLGVIQKIKDKPNKLYFGLYSNFEYLHRVMECFLENIQFDKMKHYSSTYRPKITIKLKQQVWKEYNGNDLNGKCFCCEDDLHYDEAEYGHNISVAKGGESILENLRPICRTCNKDMNIMRLDDYKKLLLKN